MGTTQADPCARLRRQMNSLQAELAHDERHLQELRDSHAGQASTDEWTQVVRLKGSEVTSTREQMIRLGCFDPLPPRPQVPAFIELGPGAVLDGKGKILGTGAVIDIVPHPTDAKVILVATAGGGVWATRNASASSQAPDWQPLTDQMPSSAVGAVEVARGDPNGRTVLAGTGCFRPAPPPSTRSPLTVPETSRVWRWICMTGHVRTSWTRRMSTERPPRVPVGTTAPETSGACCPTRRARARSGPSSASGVGQTTTSRPLWSALRVASTRPSTRRMARAPSGRGSAPACLAR